MESSSSISTSKSMIYVLLLVFLVFIWSSQSCYGFGSFGFDIHHRFSDAVKGILDIDELPEKGSLDYYVAMAHRDRVFRGRRLAAGENTDELLTFSNGNRTIRLPSLGFLHYANVSLGTPSLSFLVALDTGSDLFWVPCDCGRNCVQGLRTRSGAQIDLNIYSSNSSSTSKQVPCISSLCEYRSECPAATSQCPYQVLYLSNGTSSTGVLVEDVLHLTAEDGNPQVVDAPITFGCGRIQTGSFLDSAAPNGLFGLGMEKSSVPSILSSSGLVANSFSMCFGTDGIGRISFGDKGSANQEETPFNFRPLHPTYNITVTQITVDKNHTNVSFSAIFDSGTSFTYLNDPAYTHITETFNSQALDRRHASDPGIPFEYCYDIKPNSNDTLVPHVTLTMKGGSQYPIIDPIVVIPDETGYRYCLAVVKSPNVNIIGQNFMTGYRVVFDREKMVLGWKKSNCYDIENSNNLATNRPMPPVVPPAIAFQPGSYPPEATKRPISPVVPPVVPPVIAVQPGSYTPEATKKNGKGFNSGASQPSIGKPPRLYLIISSFLMMLVPILLIG